MDLGNEVKGAKIKNKKFRAIVVKELTSKFKVYGSNSIINHFFINNFFFKISGAFTPKPKPNVCRYCAKMMV